MNVTFGGESHEIPSGAVIGCVGATGSGVEGLLQACAGIPGVVAMEYTLDRQDALARLRAGVDLNDGRTLPAEAERIAEPALWPRDPPVRFRKSVSDCWLALTLREGRNRQARRMTAAVGHPTLRLVRWAIGEWDLGQLAPGEWRDVAVPTVA